MHLSLMWGSLARCSVRSSAPNTRHIQAELQMVFLDSLREAYGFDITPLRQWNMRWCSQTHSHLSLLPSNSWQAVTSLIRQKCCMAHLKCGAIKSLINNCLYVCIINHKCVCVCVCLWSCRVTTWCLWPSFSGGLRWLNLHSCSPESSTQTVP